MVERAPLPLTEFAAAVACRKYFVSFARGERPFVFFAPFVFTHDENFYGLAVGEAILRAFEEEVVPLEDYVVFVDVGLGAEIDVADFRAVAGVAADDDHELLAVARGVVAAVRLDAEIVAKRAAEKNVVPRGDVQSGDVNVGEMLFDRDFFPVVVVVGMREPVEIVRRERFG